MPHPSRPASCLGWCLILAAGALCAASSPAAPAVCSLEVGGTPPSHRISCPSSVEEAILTSQLGLGSTPDQACSTERARCLLCFHGDISLTLEPSIVGLQLKDLDGLICATGRSRITLQHGQLVDNSIGVSQQAKASGGPLGSSSLVAVWDDAEVTVHNISFIGNKGRYGTAAAVYGNGRLGVSSSEFIDNTAADAGGALFVSTFVSSASAALQVVSSNFTRNVASQYGGAIAQFGGKVTLRDCKFALNQGSVAPQHSEGAFVRGGAVFVSGPAAWLDVTGSRFANNSVDGEQASPGGAVCAQTSAVVSMSGCEFSYNSACDRGGAIGANSSSIVTIRQSTFLSNKGNTSHALGAGVDALNLATINLHGCQFRDQMSRDFGAAMNINNASLVVNASEFHGNRVVGKGGPVFYASNNASLLMANSIMSNNEAEWGGAGFCEGDGTRVFIMGSKCTGNHALSGGCMVVQNGCHMVVEDTTISNNTARSFGGGMQLQGTSSVNLTRVALIGNRASASGGALDISGSANLWINDTTIDAHYAFAGAGLAVRAGKVTLGPNVSITNNNASESGGGLFLTQGQVDLHANVSIVQNRAGTTGGGIALHLSACRASVRGPDEGTGPREACLTGLGGSDGAAAATTVVTNNSAGLAGGGLFISADTPLEASTLARSYRKWAGIASNLANYGDGNVYATSTSDGPSIGRRGYYTRDNSTWSFMCPPGQYNMDASKLECTTCPKWGNCSLGGAVLVPLPSYWASRTDHCQPHTIMRCPNPKACAHNADMSELASSHPYHPSHEQLEVSCSSGLCSREKELWTKFSESLCAPGYSGVLCSICQKGYGQAEPFSCERCLGTNATNPVPDASGIVGSYVAYTLFFVGMVLFTVWQSLKGEATVDSSRSANSAPGRRPRMEALSSMLHWMKSVHIMDVVKASTMHTQYLILVIARVPVGWPSILDEAFGWLSNVWGLAFGGKVPLDCVLQLLRQDMPSYERAVMKGFLNLVVVPGVTLAAALLCILAWRSLCSRPRRGSPQEEDSGPGLAAESSSSGALCLPRHVQSEQNPCCRLPPWVVVAGLVNSFFFFPSIARVAVMYLACVPVCSTQWLWLADTSSVCPWFSAASGNTGLFLGMAAALVCFSLITWVVVWLLYAPGWSSSGNGTSTSVHRRHACESCSCPGPELRGAWQLRLDRLASSRFRQSYSFMYCDYSYGDPELLAANRWFASNLRLVWDAVIHLWTLLLVMVSTWGIALHEYHQMLLLVVLFGAYLLTVLAVRPFRQGSHELQCLSLTVLFLTCVLALVFIKPDGIGLSKEVFAAVALTFAVAIIAANLTLILFMLLVLGCSLWNQYWPEKHRSHSEGLFVAVD